MGLRAEIWTRDLPNTKNEHWPVDHDVRSPTYEIDKKQKQI
jgi:hypothetical protein